MYPAYPDHDADGAERADAPASDARRLGDQGRGGQRRRATNGDGTMDQSEFISLLESKHPILMRIAWVRELEKGFHDGEDDEKIAALDVDAGRRPVFMLSPNDQA
ncbi:voltage-gated potassium channel [Aureococcus anophagefferens]|nr:voltage-gated potassium channel [Aureococcus anophagefferens]